MSFDLVVGILGLAIAAGQVYTANSEERPRVIVFSTLAVAVIICGWGAYNFFAQVKHQSEVRQRADRVFAVLDGPKTFDDIMSSLNFLAFDDVNEAMDYLDDTRRIKPNVIHVRAPDGRDYAVRTFIRTN